MYHLHRFDVYSEEAPGHPRGCTAVAATTHRTPFISHSWSCAHSIRAPCPRTPGNHQSASCSYELDHSTHVLQTHMVFFLLCWLILRSLMSSRCALVLAGVGIPFSFEAEQYSIWMYRPPFVTLSSVPGHVGGFHLLVNNPVRTSCVQIVLWVPAFHSFRNNLRIRIAGSYTIILYHYITP